MKAIRTNFVAPYKGKSTNIPFLDYKKKQSGVYLIRSDRTGQIIYIGFSEGNLYKTIYRHFQEWTDISREVKTRFTYNKTGYSVRVIFCNPGRAALLEKYLIMKMKPRDNDYKYQNYLTPSQIKTAEDTEITVFTGDEKYFPF